MSNSTERASGNSVDPKSPDVDTSITDMEAHVNAAFNIYLEVLKPKKIVSRVIIAYSPPGDDDIVFWNVLSEEFSATSPDNPNLDGFGDAAADLIAALRPHLAVSMSNINPSMLSKLLADLEKDGVSYTVVEV